jgi:hypothetical protein
MSDEDETAIVRGQLIAIKQSVERILDHHDGFKEDLREISKKFEKVNNDIHDETIDRHKGDADVKDELHKALMTIYVSVAVGSLALISNIVLWVVKGSVA